jgi:hypothetical protein
MNKLSLCILLLVFLAGCTSLQEQAMEHYEAGDYAAAAAVNEKILRKSPNDPIAVEHLRKTRQKLIERNLIEARQLRLSNNLRDAHLKLKQIVRNQKEWNLSPAGAAFSAQQEELEFLFEWLQEQARLLKKNKKYLKLKILLQENNELFVHSDMNSSFQSLERDIEREGAAHCLELRSIVTGYLSKEFWKHYCVFWGQQTQNEPAVSLSTGFGHIEIKGEIKEIPPEVMTVFSESLFEALKTSPFYQADGKSLTVQAGGRFASDYREEKSMGIHSYDEEVPYQAYETVSYVESEPVTSYVKVKDPVTQKEKFEPKTTYKNVTKYREEAVTRYRKEARTLTYPKVDFNVDYSLNSQFSFLLDGVKYLIPINEKMHISDSYHDVNNPRIGLVERPKKVPTETFWLKQQSDTLRRNALTQVRDSWSNKYCNFKAPPVKASQAEVVLKCAAGVGSSKGLVDSWSSEVFQMSYNELQRALGI